MWHAQILDLNFSGMKSLAQRMDNAPNIETRPVRLNDKAGDTSSALFWIAAGKQQTIVRTGSTTDPKLAAIDYPFVAISLGAGLNCSGRIAAARGFRQTKKGFLLAA